MPGHEVSRSNTKNPALFDKYQCPHCKLLLKDAVQPVCGHWLCESCAGQLLESPSPKCPRPDCLEDLKADAGEGAELEYFPDRFVRREIREMIVSCSHRQKGCQWEDKLIKLKDHLMSCSFTTIGCQDCGEVLAPDKVKSHTRTCPKALVKCPLVEFGCQHNQDMTRQDLEKHVSTVGLEHIEVICDNLRKIGKQGKDVIEPIIAPHTQFDDESNATGQEFHQISDAVETDHAVRVKSKGVRPVQRDGPRMPTDGPRMTTDTAEESDYAGEKKITYQATLQDSSRMAPDEASTYGLPDANALQVHAVTTLKNATSMVEAKVVADLKRKDEEISVLRSTMTKLEKAMRSKHAEFEDRDFRLSLIENSSHDGSMIWKIPQFSQRMADAQSGRYTSIFSLPFHSGRYGYKMCLRLYILGDGIGKNTHMSLFFVVMKGEFDNILPWPFTHKVTFKLINQTGGRDIIDTFQPDPMSSSFRKPKSDMNIASGCPRFASHTELKNGGFILDDTVFIKCSIDCATVKHP